MHRAAGFLGASLLVFAAAGCGRETADGDRSGSIGRAALTESQGFETQQLGGNAVLGPELELDTPVVLAQDGQNPAFAAGPNLSLIVSAMRTLDPVQGIHAARVARDGTVLDPGGILVSTTGGGPFFFGTSPSAIWVQDRFFVAYNDAFEIKGALVTADGSAGPEFTVVTNGNFSRDEILLDLASDGESVMMLWTDLAKLHCRRFARDGALLGDTELAPSLSYYPSALAYGDQQYLVVGGTTGGPAAVRVDRNGVVLDSAPVALGVPAAKATNVAVAWHAPEFLVAWSDSRDTVTGPDIYAARVGTDGRVTDAAGLAVQSSNAREVIESVSTGDSAYLMTFRVEDNAPPLELRAARVSFAGQALGALSAPIASYGSEPPGGSSLRTSVASWDGTQHWIAWPGILGIRVQDDGTRRDSAAVQISKRWASEEPRFIAPTASDFYLTWGNLTEHRANRLSTAGALESVRGFALPAIGFPAGLHRDNLVLLSTLSRCIPRPSSPACSSFPTDLQAQRTTLTGEVLTPAPAVILTSANPFSLSYASLTWNGNDAFLLNYNCNGKFITESFAPFGPDYSHCSPATVWDGAAFLLSKGGGVDAIRMDGTVVHHPAGESSTTALVATGDSRNLLAFTTAAGDVYASLWTPGLTSRLGADQLISDRPGTSAMAGATWTGVDFVVFWKEQIEGTKRNDLLAARVRNDGTVLDQGGFLVQSNREFASERIAGLNGATAIMYQGSVLPSTIGLRAKVRLLWSDGTGHDGGSVTAPRGLLRPDAGLADSSADADSDAAIDGSEDAQADTDSADASDDATPSDASGDSADDDAHLRDAMADAGGGAPANDASRPDAGGPAAPPAPGEDEGCGCGAAGRPAGTTGWAALIATAFALYSARQRSRRRPRASA